MLLRPHKDSYTCAAANTTGFASNVTGATWTLSATNAGDNLAHKVTIHNDSGTDHSAKTALITGTNANGLAQTETVNLPGATLTVTGSKYFLTVTSIVPSATIGADTMDIGWTAAAQTPWVQVDYDQASFSVSCAVTTGGTINYDLQSTLDDVNSASVEPVGINHTTMAGKTADYMDSYSSPVSAVRIDVNSHTSGTFSFLVRQGSRA